jgi:xylulokinase
MTPENTGRRETASGMEKYVCSIDLGTSTVKAALVDERGTIVGLQRNAVPAGDGSRFDAASHARLACDAVREALAAAGIAAAQVEGVAISSQRATVVPIGRDGRPAGDAISWQSTDCAIAMDRFVEAFGADRFHALTGLPPSCLWSCAKILGLKTNEPERFAATAKFALLHDYVLRELGATDFFTDPSNASLTGLLDLGTRAWAPDLLSASGLAAERLPVIAPPGARAGGISASAAAATGLLAGTPLFVGGGDQQCAALGAGVVAPGEAALCLGTAAVVSCPIRRPAHGQGVFCTVHLPPDAWVLEGIHNAYGASIGWGANVLCAGSHDDLEELAGAEAPGPEAPFFLPFLAGIGSPDFAGGVKGAFFGLTLAHGPRDLAAATLEGIAFETERILEAIDAYVPVRRLRIIGGGAKLGATTRTLAAVSGRELQLSPIVEASLLGAAAIGWAGAGRHRDLAAAAQALSIAAERPLRQPARRGVRARYVQYKKLVEVVKQIAKPADAPPAEQ